MPQRTLGTSDDEVADAASRLFEMMKRDYEAAVAKLYGPLPKWLPEPVLPQIHQSIMSLRNAGFSDERIFELVALARESKLEVVPGTVIDVTDFFKSTYHLAHVQWALSQDKARAIEELAGSKAARDYKRSKLGHEAQFGSEQERGARNDKIRKRAAELRCRDRGVSKNEIAAALAAEFNLSARQIKRIL